MNDTGRVQKLVCEKNIIELTAQRLYDNTHFVHTNKLDKHCFSMAKKRLAVRLY